MLRWGNRDDEKGVFDIGVEKRVYPSNKVWGLQVATAVGLILKDAGFLKYKTSVELLIFTRVGQTLWVKMVLESIILS